MMEGAPGVVLIVCLMISDCQKAFGNEPLGLEDLLMEIQVLLLVPPILEIADHPELDCIRRRKDPKCKCVRIVVDVRHNWQGNLPMLLITLVVRNGTTEYIVNFVS